MLCRASKRRHEGSTPLWPRSPEQRRRVSLVRALQASIRRSISWAAISDAFAAFLVRTSLRAALGAVLDVMKANEKNDHDAADIVCEECKSILVTLHRPINT